MNTLDLIELTKSFALHFVQEFIFFKYNLLSVQFSMSTWHTAALSVVYSTYLWGLSWVRNRHSRVRWIIEPKSFDLKEFDFKILHQKYYYNKCCYFSRCREKSSSLTKKKELKVTSWQGKVWREKNPKQTNWKNTPVDKRRHYGLRQQ